MQNLVCLAKLMRVIKIPISTHLSGSIPEFNGSFLGLHAPSSHQVSWRRIQSFLRKPPTKKRRSENMTSLIKMVFKKNTSIHCLFFFLLRCDRPRRWERWEHQMYKMKEYSRDISQHSTLTFKPEALLFCGKHSPWTDWETAKRKTELKFPPIVYLCVYRPW